MANFVGKSKSTANTLSLMKATRSAGRNLILWGPPGVGKTALIKALADEEGAELRVLLGSILDPTDVSGLPLLSTNSDGVPITRSTLPDWADALNKAAEAGRGAILFLDEISTTTPAVQAALLTVVQGRIVGQNKLHDDVWIIAAANNAEDAADGWLLSPPMANRFAHIEFTFSEDDWFDGMRVAFGKDGISAEEKEARSMIVAFLRQNKKLIKAMPSDPEEAGRAWPSPRSWDNAAAVMGRIADRPVQRIAMRGFVGENAEQAYDLWQKNLKLPPYSEVIANPDKFKWDGFKTDEVWMILNTVLENLNKDNVKATANVFEVANVKGGKGDVCASLALPLIEAVNVIFAEQGGGDKTILLSLFKTYVKELKEAGVS